MSSHASVNPRHCERDLPAKKQHMREAITFFDYRVARLKTGDNYLFEPKSFATLGKCPLP